MKGVLLRWWQPRHNGTGHDRSSQVRLLTPQFDLPSIWLLWAKDVTMGWSKLTASLEANCLLRALRN